MSRNLFVLAAGLVVLLAGSAFADEPGTSQRYGSGVHAFFSGDYLKAYDQLTSAIDDGSLDPRCYYYRGLTYIKLGREPEAEMDFAKGAELETKDTAGFFDVASALQRVQGTARLTIEQYRVDARTAAIQRAEAMRKARYEAIREEESRVLATAIEPATAGTLGVFVDQPGEQTDPVVDNAAPPDPLETADPFGAEPGELQIVTQPDADPFGAEPGELQIVPDPVDFDDAQPGTGLFYAGALGRALGQMLSPARAAAPSSPPSGDLAFPPFPIESNDDPFGEPDEPTTMPVDDPFSGDVFTPAGDDPIPAPVDDPFSADPLAPAADPFSPEPPVSEPPVTEPPETEPPVADPFSGGSPVADPFAGEPVAEPPAADTPAPAAPVDDPFSGAPAGDSPAAPPVADPFSGTPAIEPPIPAPPASDPFGREPAAPPVDDPFASEPAAEPPAPQPPASEPVDDPFA